jgi:hypothetical protein
MSEFKPKVWMTCPLCNKPSPFPDREWVDLTDEDKQKLVAEHHDWESLYFAIQAKLKERNHDSSQS